MRYIYTLLLVLLSSSPMHILPAQDVPNGGFEEWWQSPALSIPEQPVDWNVTLIPNQQFIFRDTIPYAGEWAMRVYPAPDGVISYSEASTDIEISSLPEALNFYAKWEKTPTASVGVELSFMNNEAIVFNESWSPSTDTSAWMQISIPIQFDDPVINHVKITVYTIVGDLLPGDGWIAVDELQFEDSNGIDKFNSTDLFIGPNPCDSEIKINSDRYDQSTVMVVYDNVGHIIHIGNMTSRFDTSELSNGIYTLQIGDGKDLVKERFQVLH